MKDTKQISTSFKISEELWRQFKIVCTAEDTNIKDKVNDLVSQYVKKNISKTRNSKVFAV